MIHHDEAWPGAEPISQKPIVKGGQGHHAREINIVGIIGAIIIAAAIAGILMVLAYEFPNAAKITGAGLLAFGVYTAIKPEPAKPTKHIDTHG